jgi:threonine/homoserine/homoserine lactone efflux protein
VRAARRTVFRSGAAAALGVGAGCFVHVAAAALGLSALIASSAAAFTVLRWVAQRTWCGWASACCAAAALRQRMRSPHTQ